MSARFVAICLTSAVLIGAPARAIAQHHTGGQTHDHAGGVSDRGPELQQALRKADKTVTKATASLDAFKARYERGDTGAPAPAMLPILSTILAQMHALHASLQTQAGNPATLYNGAAAKAFRQACESLAQMATAFDGFLRHLTTLQHGS